MNAKLRVPPELSRSLRTFVRRQRIPLDVVTAPDGDVQVLRPSRPAPCSPDRLLAGGWITCACAQALSARLAVKPRSLGKLLNHLGIKVRRCELGLFR